MTFWQGLLMGRSHVALLGGLAIALGVAWAVGRALPHQPRTRSAEIEWQGGPEPRPPGAPLSSSQLAAAKAAWTYFERNTRATGLTDSVEGFPATTLWDQGSSLMAMLGAQRLGIISRDELVKRAGAAIESLARAPLLSAGVPNKSYDTRSLKMTDYAGNESPRGIGWSSIDIARFAVPLTVLAWQEPRLTPRIRSLLASWRLDRLVSGGELLAGEVAPDGSIRTAQEGRLGYEQYAARSLSLLGYDASRAQDFRRHLTWVEASGVRAPADDRDPAAFGGTTNAVTSEPFILLGAEVGVDADWRPLAQALLTAQERRANETSKLTAVSEDHLDRDPRFVYFSVTEGGRAWVARTPDGRDAAEFRALSTKAALGWSTLFSGAYADRLLQGALELAEPGRGLWSGRYESNGQPNRVLTSNTNGIALELLAAQVHGPWLRAARREVP
jgi:hypothetical protein